MLSERLLDFIFYFLDWKVLGAFVFLELIYTFFFSITKSIPGPLYTRFTNLGNIYATLSGEGVQFIYRLHQKYGDIVRLGPKSISVASPEGFQLLLREMEIPKSPIYEGFGKKTSLSTFSMTNKVKHRQRRRIISQAFSLKTLRSMEPSMVEVGVNRMMSFVDRHQGDPVDITEFFHRVSLDIIGKVGFGASFEFLEDELCQKDMKQVKKAVEFDFSQSFLFSIFPWLSKFTFLPVTQQQMWSRITLTQFAEKLRDERLAIREQQPEVLFNDLLDHILVAADPSTGEKLTMEEVAVEILSFLEAGSESSANSMSWTIYLLLQHPKILLRVQEEIRRVSPQRNELVTHETARDSLPFLNAVLNESMRMIPVVAVGTFRVLDSTTQLGQYTLQSGTEVNCSIYSLHLNPKVWNEPLRFDPTRFLTLKAGELKNRFEPFSCGIRNCIGKEVALMEMRLLLSNLLKFYELRLFSKNSSIKPTVKFTLVPDRPIYVQFKRASF